MTAISSSEITELVCTRISHDLIGNIGSISNALELLEESTDDIDDIKPILAIGSEILIARLKFFRLAFGLKNAAPKNFDEMCEIAQNYLKTFGGPNDKQEIVWKIDNVSLYKVVYLGLMALSDVLIKGGRFEVLEANDGLKIKVTSEYNLSKEKLKNIQKAVEGKISEDNPALLAPVVYLNSLLEEVGVHIILEATDKEAVLNLK